MTQRAHCPKCNSPFYAPDPSNGGTGRNKCFECGQASPVASWYTERVFGDYGKFAAKPSEPITREQYSALYQQSPKYFPIPDGYEWDKKTGTIREAKADRTPAPIRQYKDD